MTPPINAAEIERLAELVKDASPHGTYSSRAATHFVISVPILIAALREAVGAVEKVTSMVDDFTGNDCMFCHKNHPGHSRDLHDAGCFYELADQALRSIAEKVEGL